MMWALEHECMMWALEHESMMWALEHECMHMVNSSLFRSLPVTLFLLVLLKEMWLPVPRHENKIVH